MARLLVALVAALVVLAASGLAHPHATFAHADSVAPESAGRQAVVPSADSAAHVTVSPGPLAFASRATVGWPSAGGVVSLQRESMKTSGYFLIGLGVTLAVSGTILWVYSSRRRARLVAEAPKPSSSLD